MDSRARLVTMSGLAPDCDEAAEVDASRPPIDDSCISSSDSALPFHRSCSPGSPYSVRVGADPYRWRP